MKQTAVEFLSENYIYVIWLTNRDEITASEADKIRSKYFEQAKEMEEQQRDEFAIAFAEYVLDWNRDTTSDYLQIILEQFKNK
jgi:hypothetical protein